MEFTCTPGNVEVLDASGWFECHKWTMWGTLAKLIVYALAWCVIDVLCPISVDAECIEPDGSIFNHQFAFVKAIWYYTWKTVLCVCHCKNFWKQHDIHLSALYSWITVVFVYLWRGIRSPGYLLYVILISCKLICFIDRILFDCCILEAECCRTGWDISATV